MHAEGREPVAQTIGNLVVKKWEQPITAVHEGDVHAESFEDGSVFATDDAAADDREAFGDAIHLQKSVRVERVNVVESDLSGPMRFGAGGDEEDFAFQPARALRS